MYGLNKPSNFVRQTSTRSVLSAVQLWLRHWNWYKSWVFLCCHLDYDFSCWNLLSSFYQIIQVVNTQSRRNMLKHFCLTAVNSLWNKKKTKPSLPFPFGLIEVTVGSVVSRWPPPSQFDPVTHFLSHLSVGLRAPGEQECVSVCEAASLCWLNVYAASPSLSLNYSASLIHSHTLCRPGGAEVVLSTPAVNLYQTCRK